MKKLLLTFLLCSISSYLLYAQKHYSGADLNYVEGGGLVQRIDLNDYALPTVTITNIETKAISALPKGATASAFNNESLSILLGLERKQPFAWVRMPQYALAADGKGYLELTGFTLNVKEASPSLIDSKNTAARGTGAASAFANGNWYKIGVSEEGFYKVDYEFIKNKLGIDPAGFNAANFRLLGSGGAMLSEKNLAHYATAPAENAFFMQDGGDGSFGPGDYFVFYSAGPMSWIKDSAQQRFLHVKHLYDTKSYYFLSFDQGSGLRVATQGAVPPATVTVNTYNDRMAHEEDLYNPGKFGKEWYGELFSQLGSAAVLTKTFDLAGGATDLLRVRIATAVRSKFSGSTFTTSYNGSVVDQHAFGAVALEVDQPPVTLHYANLSLAPSASAQIKLDFNPAVTEAKGYLNYIEVNTRRNISISGGQIFFRDWNSVAPGAVASFQVSSANANTQVWDVSNPAVPVKMNGMLAGGNYSFQQNVGELREFAAFDGSRFGTPTFEKKIPNQNLQALSAKDLVIISPPEFTDAANRLADYHQQHDQLRSLVVSPEQIYNEFSSGAQDISAIRNFMRMLYDNASTSSDLPRYLLLLGDASYDYKDRTPSNTNLVPTFEAAESQFPGSSYCSDEYYAFLDVNEEIENYAIPNTLDIGVGRLPVQSAQEAEDVVDKIIAYHAPASLGPWRLNNTFVADNEDVAGPHLLQADTLSQVIENLTTIYHGNKVYLDNYEIVSTPGGNRCPDANKAINDQLYKGTFLVNYSGHGNTKTLAEERILTPDDYNKWNNKNKMPFMVTATCDFSRYDNPDERSAGEKISIKAKGGAIAMLTTVQAVYANPNARINSQFLRTQLTKKADGTWHTFGDAIRIGKNLTYMKAGNGDIQNFRMFTLLGDPALLPAFPEHVVRTTAVKNNSTQQNADTIKALGNYTISGEIADHNQQLKADFNGRLSVTIYDKKRTVSLITRDSIVKNQRSFLVEDNLIYKGNVSVTNGTFSFSFIAPKDLNYDFGNARILYYAENGVTDAAGDDRNIISGGFSDQPSIDDDSPLVKAFINDTLFRNGGLTGANTSLYVKLSDESGINVSGNSIGHDLIAILDGNVSEPFNLNDYYETETNTYKKGFVKFPINNLADGKHTITVKAWDVNNNSGEGSVDFVVGNSNVFQIQKLMNYPNPFTTETHFIFEHNHPEEELDVKIAIYNSAGAMVKLLEDTFTPSGSHSNEIVWDGTGANGMKLASGVYPYRLILSTKSGIQATAYQKLVLVR